MTLSELHTRMQGFLDGDYHAYFFLEEENLVGYALVNHSTHPLYLRQFLIDRKYRKHHIGTKAFALLLKELNVNTIDIEVLSRNTVGIKFWEKCGFIEKSRYMRYVEIERDCFKFCVNRKN